MLPDVIGAWKNDGNRGDPGGAGRNGVELDMTSLHDVQPTSPTDTAYQEPQVVDLFKHHRAAYLFKYQRQRAEATYMPVKSVQ